MLTKVWKPTLPASGNARLEEHTYRDGSKHYSFRNRNGFPINVQPKEVNRIIKSWKMVDATKEFNGNGWID